jgi:hypothetical protein
MLMRRIDHIQSASYFELCDWLEPGSACGTTRRMGRGPGCGEPRQPPAEYERTARMTSVAQMIVQEAGQAWGFAIAEMRENVLRQGDSG